MKKMLIFGIGGFVGAYLTEELLQHGYSVFGSDMVPECRLPQGVGYQCVNLLDPDGVRKLIDEVQPDGIVNLAAISSVGQSWGIPQTTISVNVVGGLNILEAVRAAGNATKVMFVGSSEEYETSDRPIDETVELNSNNPYGISKIAQEQFAKLYHDHYGMQVYCVRPFNHTGVGQRNSFVIPSFCEQAAAIERSGAPGRIMVGNLAAKRDFSHVKDIVRAYRMIMESEDCTKIYNVGAGKAYGLDEILNYIVSLCPQRIEVVVDPERFRPVDTPVICCDNHKIREELGWEPEYDVYKAVEEMYQSFIG